MRESFKERRAFERIPVTIAVRFSCNSLLHTVYYGTVADISESGMLIRTGTCFAGNTHIRLFIYRGKILLVQARVKRVVKADGFYEAMGIEVIDPSEEYLDFIAHLKNTAD